MSDQLNIIRVTPLMNTQRFRNGLLGVIVVILTLVLGLWVGRMGRTEPSAAVINASQPAGLSAQSVAPNQPAGTPVEVLTTTLGPAGFTPNKINHAAGSFRLKVNNQSKQQEIVLRLSNTNGEKVSEVTVTNSVHAWVGKLDLGPGDYLLSETKHPNWKCQISVLATRTGG